jgi:hypothetical protein
MRVHLGEYEAMRDRLPVILALIEDQTGMSLVPSYDVLD